MLSIGKLAAGPGAGRYYEDALARGREDYYGGEGEADGEAPGAWVGSGSVRLGLSGEVAEGQIERLLAGRHPASGLLLGAEQRSGAVAGFDLTFKAPKSVSILFGIAANDVVRELVAGHDAAVEEALGYLERRACRARRGRNGVTEVEAGGFVAAAFRHRTSRAGDPLLHTHLVLANRVEGPDGRWTAPDARHVYRQAKTAGYLYQAALRAELTERLGLEWTLVDKGTAEVTGFPRAVIEHFSRRRAEIVAELEQRGHRSPQAAQTAALATRRGKDYGVPIGRLRAEWRARAAEHGIDLPAVERMLAGRGRAPRAPRTVRLEDLTRSTSTFTRSDVLQAAAAVHPDGERVLALERVADRLLEDPEIVPALTATGEQVYTTREHLELERGLLERAKRRASPLAQARGDLVADAITRRELSPEQSDLVRSLTASDRLISVVRAPAGAGKTFALDAAREAWVRNGVPVIGCALSARAAAELRDQAAIDTTTIARLRTGLDHGHALPLGGVLLVDEAGMVGTRDLAALAEHVESRSGRLVLVGDDRQLPEIEAGGAFRTLAERTRAHELTEVQRQRDVEDRAALQALREGDLETWAQRYRERGDLATAPNAPALREQLVADWWDAREAGDAALMLAFRRRDVADLNDRARARLRAHGRLIGDDVRHGAREYAVGDEVVARRNDRHLDVVNGDLGSVTSAAPGHVDVRLASGRDVRLPGDYAAEHLDHAYAVTAHRAQGTTVDRAFVLGSDEQYREWGYTALSRHRERARFYLTAPPRFLNRDAAVTLTEDELAQAAAGALRESRRKEMAAEAVERHPNGRRLLPRRSAPVAGHPERQPAAAKELAELLGRFERATLPEPARDPVPLELMRPRGPDLDRGMDLGR